MSNELHDDNIMSKMVLIFRKLIKDETRNIKADKEFTGIIVKEPSILGYIDVAPNMTLSETDENTPYIPNVRTDPNLRCRKNDEVLCVAINGDMNNIVARLNKNNLETVLRLPFRTVVTNSTIKISDTIIYCNISSGNITLTLPDATKCAGICMEFIKVDGTSNTCTVVGYSGQTINGVSNMLVNSTYPKRWIQSINSGWWII